MKKSFYTLILLAPLAAACVQIVPPTCGPVASVETIYTKEGFPILDDQSPIMSPCDAMEHDQHEQPEQPKYGKAKGNNGWGNGDQDAPANSEFNNNAENRGGNRNGRDESPAKSWPDR